MTDLQTTVNACFPRSGHRFLRNLCRHYFGPDLVFESARTRRKGASTATPNYIKDHDFGLRLAPIGIPVAPGIRYLVQYRHPLESAVSYFEFSVRQGRLTDDRAAWESFLSETLEYWKRFVTRWCLSDETRDNPMIHRVQYKALHENTTDTLRQVIAFLTAGSVPIDGQRLDAAVGRYGTTFARYVEDEHAESRKLANVRDVRDFRYFDSGFTQLEEVMTADFLTPLAIERLFASPAP